MLFISFQVRASQAIKWTTDTNEKLISPHYRQRKFSPNVGYRRDQITHAMLNSPYDIYNFIYGSSRLGIVQNKNIPYCMISWFHIILNFISELVRFSNERIANHNTKVDSPRRRIRPITDKELRMVLAILIIGKQEKGTMEFRMWYKNRLLSRINMFSEIGGFPSYNVNFISCTRFYQILRFLSPGAIQYVPRQAWKKSSASTY